jgi:flagellar L-ring protein precursor FlgH
MTCPATTRQFIPPLTLEGSTGKIGAKMRLLLVFSLSALRLAAQIGGLGGSPGSLYTASGMLANASRDLKANGLDDMLTIVVNENTSAVAAGVTNTQRTSTAATGISGLLGKLPATSKLANVLTSSNAQQLQGTGTTSRTSTLTTTVSARVVDVTPNGTLVVEGTKQITVNSEHQTITLRGLVRPSDLTTANTVQSTQVGNLEIHVAGKGVVNDAIKRPFFLYRLLLGLLPF